MQLSIYTQIIYTTCIHTYLYVKSEHKSFHKVSSFLDGTRIYGELGSLKKKGRIERREERREMREGGEGEEKGERRDERRGREERRVERGESRSREEKKRE